MSEIKILSRRNLLKATTLFGAQATVPFAFAQTVTLTSAKDPDTWSSKALPLGQHAIGAIKRHPFINEVCSGALAKPAFISYMALNIEYLDQYAKSLEYLGARVGVLFSLSHQGDLLRTWAKETDSVRDWCIKLYQEVARKEYSPKRVKRFAAGEDYAQFERCYAVKYDVAVGMAALLPCFWVYDQIGARIAKLRQTQDNPYAEWLESFGTIGSQESSQKAVALADTLARQADDNVRQQMTDVFVAGCWKEYACFDAAYRSLFRNL